MPRKLVQYLLNENYNPAQAMITIRRIFTHVEEIRHEFGPEATVPLLRGAIGAVLINPFAGRFEPNILPMMDALQDVGIDMAHRLLAAMQLPVERIASYGKGAVVGAAGELEHGALWHVPGGYAMRERLGDAKAIVPSAKKVGAFGSKLDVPLGHINAAYVRSHFDAMEVGISDGPRPDEILFCLAMTCGPRVHDRMGGLAAGDIKAWDGLR